MILHLVFDGAWNNTEVFWWPFFGVSFDDDPLPILDRGWWSLPLEAIGVAICVWLWRHNRPRRSRPPSRVLPQRSTGCGAGTFGLSRPPHGCLWDTATVLILVRHGRTPANAAGLLQGRLDQDLDEFGQAAGDGGGRLRAWTDARSMRWWRVRSGGRNRPPRRSGSRSRPTNDGWSCRTASTRAPHTPTCRPRCGSAGARTRTSHLPMASRWRHSMCGSVLPASTSSSGHRVRTSWWSVTCHR